ncbi:MAG: FtsX-like permease family protein, partial [Mogibacterium sp.]|nr:FtsX-like permease family protein [Mogibacterium sp.]
ANTLEVMNIIKAISRERLVLLVTHERNIAEFYSDHVAEILDGKVVKAYNNDSSKYLDFQLENKIYLKDMAVQKSVKMDGIKAGFYSDEERELDIKLVIRGSNIYIDTGGTYTVIDENTNIEMVDDHYSALDETFFEENKFKYDAHLPEDFKPKYTSLYTPMNLISKGFKSVSNFKKTKKFLLLGFVFAAMFTFLAISNIMGIFDIDDSEFVVTNQNYITVNNTTHSTDLMNQVASTEGAGYVIPGDSKYSLTLPLDDFLQSSQFYTNISVSLVRSDMIEDKDIIYGNRPQNVREVVLDKMVIDKVLESDEAKGVGLTKVESFVGRRITVPKVGDFWISGVCDIKSPSLFADESMLGYILTNAESTSGDGGAATSEDRQKDSTLAYGLRPDTLSITKGRAPSSDYEAIASEDHKYDYTLNKTIDKTVNGHKLTIVGFYKNGGQEDTYYVSDNTMLLDYIGSAKMFQVYAKDTGAFEKKLSEQGVKYSNNYDRDKETYMKSVTKSLKSSTIVALILLAISLIEMYLMLRSSFLSRIKEVGIMRAIGLKKKDIYRMFAGEIVVITVITSIPGIALMYYILKNIIKITSYLESMYMVTPFVALISFVLLIVFNLLVGLIPVFRTLRKTPAEILARTDI